MSNLDYIAVLAGDFVHLAVAMPLGFETKMEVSDAQSSSSISPPPDSPPNHSLPSDTIAVAKLSGEGVVNSAFAPSPQPAASTNSNAPTSTTTANTNGAAPEKPKRTRKKK